MMVLVIVSQPTALSKLVGNHPYALHEAPNTLVIKIVCMPPGKLKVTKWWPELAEAHDQQHHQLHFPVSIAL